MSIISLVSSQIDSSARSRSIPLHTESYVPNYRFAILDHHVMLHGKLLPLQLSRHLVSTKKTTICEDSIRPVISHQVTSRTVKWRLYCSVFNVLAALLCSVHTGALHNLARQSEMDKGGADHTQLARGRRMVRYLSADPVTFVAQQVV